MKKINFSIARFYYQSACDSQPRMTFDRWSMPEASKGVLYNSFTSHKPLLTILCFGEELPSHSFDALQHSHRETVEIIFDSICNLSSFSVTSNTLNEKLF
jgi:hypothetical protein